MLDASRHFLANFLVTLNYICKGLALNPKNDLQSLSKPFQTPLPPLGTLHSDAYHTCEGCDIQQRRAEALFNLPLHRCPHVYTKVLKK